VRGKRYWAGKRGKLRESRPQSREKELTFRGTGAGIVRKTGSTVIFITIISKGKVE